MATVLEISDPALELDEIGTTLSCGYVLVDTEEEFIGAQIDPGLAGPGAGTRYYQMRGVDATCEASMQPAYVTWQVVDDPDTDASECPVGNMICGSDPTVDLVNIHVQHSWLGPEP